jgi:predicted glycosyltransferase
MLDSLQWLNPPIILEDGIEFVSLLKGVDAVVTSGGTMAREAAYLGIPAFSIFKGKKCAVDKYLESLGELVFIENSLQLARTSFQKRVLRKKPQSGALVLDEIVTEMLLRTKNAG